MTAHSAAFHHLFKNRCRVQHFEHYLTGLIAPDNNMTRCIINSPDKTDLSRFYIEANNLRIIAETGKPVELDKPKIKLSEPVPLIPAPAFRAVAVGEQAIVSAK